MNTSLDILFNAFTKWKQCTFFVALLLLSFSGSVVRAAWSWVEKWHETRADFTCLCPLGKDSTLLSLRQAFLLVSSESRAPVRKQQAMWPWSDLMYQVQEVLGGIFNGTHCASPIVFLNFESVRWAGVGIRGSKTTYSNKPWTEFDNVAQ